MASSHNSGRVSEIVQALNLSISGLFPVITENSGEFRAAVILDICFETFGSFGRRRHRGWRGDVVGGASVGEYGGGCRCC